VPFVNITTSSRYTKQQIHVNPRSTQSISRWNVLGALHKPKGIA
jgi:hypothetical protein